MAENTFEPDSGAVNLTDGKLENLKRGNTKYRGKNRKKMLWRKRNKFKINLMGIDLVKQINIKFYVLAKCARV